MSLCQLCAHYGEGHMLPQACELGEFRSECVERGKFVPRDYPSFREALEREVIRLVAVPRFEPQNPPGDTIEELLELRREVASLRAAIAQVGRELKWHVRESVASGDKQTKSKSKDKGKGGTVIE